MFKTKNEMGNNKYIPIIEKGKKFSVSNLVKNYLLIPYSIIPMIYNSI